MKALIFLEQSGRLRAKKMESEYNARSGCSKRQKRVKNFTPEEKRMLAKEVKSWPRIWDNSNAMHCNKNAMDQAWAQIGMALEKSPNECKVAWVSLRESYRYREKVAQKAKSGSGGSEKMDDPLFNDSVDWEYAEDMSFLPSVSQKRRTFTSPAFGEETTASLLSADSQEFIAAPTKHKRPAKLTQTSELSRFEKLLEKQESLIQTRECADEFSKHRRPTNLPQTSELWNRFDKLLEKQEILMQTRESAAPESSFKEAFGTFEWLLKQLPKTVADEACRNFTQSLLKKIDEKCAASAAKSEN